MWFISLQQMQCISKYGDEDFHYVGVDFILRLDDIRRIIVVLFQLKGLPLSLSFTHEKNNSKIKK